MSIFSSTKEKSSCGVGFISSRTGSSDHEILRKGLHALTCVEHRGACTQDNRSGDGAGIMTEIPFELLGYERHKIAVATIFCPRASHNLSLALRVFEETFNFYGLKVVAYREVPINASVLGTQASQSLPQILHCIIERPIHCRTGYSFDHLLHQAKQMVRTKMRERGIIKQFFFTSLSSKTIVYKGLLTASDLAEFYLDLQNTDFHTRFCLFHRRFSTNTRTTWDKAQPFRLIGHNGEINTIAGNRSWAYSREKSLGVRMDELLTHSNISDSGSLNEMVEALRYRSTISDMEDILALMIPPAPSVLDDRSNKYYEFWSRAMEPWDGPAFITYCDGRTIGARLDRNGFRPCRWAMTPEYFCLASEAGVFELDESEIEAKGSLKAGSGMMMSLQDGRVYFRDPSQSVHNWDVNYDRRIWALPTLAVKAKDAQLHKWNLFNVNKEDLDKILFPMILEGKEAIGSMGDTAALMCISDQPRSFFDYFFHNFAQVTNPPLDYIREKIVTDLATYLGKKPNIFKPSQLLPCPPAYRVDSPVLSLEQINYLRSHLNQKPDIETRIASYEIKSTFEARFGVVGFQQRLKAAAEEAVMAAKNRYNIIILSDRTADEENLPIPSLLILRSVVNALNESGHRLKVSVIVDTGEIRETHHIACLVGFGATAVCPWLALEIACFDDHKKLQSLDKITRQRNLLNAMEQGLLKIMSKSGISVVRSYESSKLFVAVGLGKKLIEDFFPGLSSPIGGIELDQLVENLILQRKNIGEKPTNLHLFREHPAGKTGERHSMTSRRSKVLQKAIEVLEEEDSLKYYEEYLRLGFEEEPSAIRHLLSIKSSKVDLEPSEQMSTEDILRTFGSGAMSFGAISAESQRDIIEAMRQIGGRSNSGEGGENPYYETDGIFASIKQIASARFGVTAQYLVTGNEVQIKIAQGAKPGEGGQLMGVKVNPDIAKARHSNPGVDLISPPPLHDIYSIEDLKQLIYELKQLKAGVKVSVKLVAGANIGTVAVGVVKAGADVIHISGGEGGTGAASLSSMKHCGLPWELGLLEVHKVLLDNGLRESVTLRVDGGLSSGEDLLKAILLGAQEFEFGKLLLIAEGCVMARICEKNSCPVGIATHDPKFKAKYKGNSEKIIRLLNLLAGDLRNQLYGAGLTNMRDAVGRTDLLEPNPKHAEKIIQYGLDLETLFGNKLTMNEYKPLFDEELSSWNHRSLNAVIDAIDENRDQQYEALIKATDRAALSTIAGELAARKHAAHLKSLNGEEGQFYDSELQINLKGSAGQGFAVFQSEGMKIRLEGEANDSVCKGISGGFTVITPPSQSTFDAANNTIVGNCALYGATGGTVYVHGVAGDRFAVRNSGATTVVESVGLHACEYMTNGIVVILGEASQNVGAGMTGGIIYSFKTIKNVINQNYLVQDKLLPEKVEFLNRLLKDYLKHTGSLRAQKILNDWGNSLNTLEVYIPRFEYSRRVVSDNLEQEKMIQIG